MTQTTPAPDARVRAPRIVPWTAFTAVFSALLMPLGVTMASGTSPATPQTRLNDEASVDDTGDSRLCLEADDAAI